MGRLSRPLNSNAVRAADDEFYAKHPELVQDGKRIPLSATDPRGKEWRELYKKQGGKEEGDQHKLPTKKPHDRVLPCEQNWIELEYLYCDGIGVAGAQYRVINNDTGGIVAQGSLDANGYAFCSLPLSVNNVSYDFDNDPPTVAYLKQPVPNPELPKVKAGWFDRMADGIADAGSWVWGTIQGDFNEDQTVGQVATNAVITMIPIVDQVGDVRDIVANLKLLIWDKRHNDKWVWIALVATLIGLIPVLGSAAKGVLKTVFKALETGGKAPLKLLIEVLNKFHKGNAIKWLRKLAADLPSHAVMIKGKFRDILKGLRDKMKSLSNILPGTLSKKVDDAVTSIDEVAKVADGKIDEAVKELQGGLNKSLDEGVDFEKKGATKTKNIRQQTDAEPPNLSEPSSPSELKQRRKFTPEERARRIDELSRDPQTGKSNPKAKKEAEAIVQAEEEGIITNARRPNLNKGEPNIDFKADEGWVEVKSAIDPKKRPIPKQAADVASHTRAQDADCFLVDLKGLSSADKTLYKSELQSAGANMSKVKFLND